MSDPHPLRIGIEVTALRKPPTGVDVYIERLLVHLGKLDSPHRYYIFANIQDAARLRRQLPPRFTVIPTAFRWRPSRTLSHQVLLPFWAAILKLDVIHSTAFIISFFCRRRPQVLMAHDMAYFTLPEGTRPPSDRLFRRAVLLSVERATRILVPSQTTARTIQAIVPHVAPEQINVVPLGVNSAFHPVPPERVRETRARLGLARNYILYVGTLEPRKNLPRLVAAYDRVRSAGRCAEDLVLAGQWGWNSGPLRAALAAAKTRDHIHVPGYVAQDDLPALYTGARLFIYPSVEEGFGLPPLEAMACGAPVLSSNRSSMAEFLAGAAELVDPEDETAIGEAIARLLSDPARLQALRKDGPVHAASFRWERTAALTESLYEELAR